MDGPLDFEIEDPLLASPVTATKRKKVIDLDDLVSEYFNEKGKETERESKRAKSTEDHDSDEDESGKEALFSEKIDECRDVMKAMGSEEEFSAWGLQLFGNQRAPPTLPCEFSSFLILQSFMSNELNSVVGLEEQEGETFLEGLLVNGWLLKLAFTCKNVEKSISEWTLNLMLYSEREDLVASACDFWCAILSSKEKGEGTAMIIEWHPSYFKLIKAMESYGYLFNSSVSKAVNLDSSQRGPPRNIRSWLKFVAEYCRGRSDSSILETAQAEELLQIVISLSLDRQLQGLLVLLRETMQSIIEYFKEEEWNSSCEKIAINLACRVPGDLNCLRTVEFISGITIRSNQLKSAFSYHVLFVCLDNKISNEEGILSLLISVDLKDKKCDLFKVYIHLALAENWLLSDPQIKDKKVIHAMLGVYLRNCACHISSTDLRPYASKVRTKASYLLRMAPIQSDYWWPCIVIR